MLNENNFGSLVDRPEFGQDGEIQTQLGPGFYPHRSGFEQRSVTAPFKGQSRTNNLFGVVLGQPGPADYQARSEYLQSKMWATNI